MMPGWKSKVSPEFVRSRSMACVAWPASNTAPTALAAWDFHDVKSIMNKDIRYICKLKDRSSRSNDEEVFKK